MNLRHQILQVPANTLNSADDESSCWTEDIKSGSEDKNNKNVRYSMELTAARSVSSKPPIEGFDVVHKPIHNISKEDAENDVETTTESNSNTNRTYTTATGSATTPASGISKDGDTSSGYIGPEKIRELPNSNAMLRIEEEVQTIKVENRQYGIETLREIGYNFLWPKQFLPLQMLRLVTKTVKTLKVLPTDHFVNAPLLKDPKNLVIVSMVSKLHHAPYNSGNLPLNFIILCKSIELSLKDGPSDTTATKLAGLGAVWTFLKNDHQTCSHRLDGVFNSKKIWHTQFSRNVCGSK